MVESIAFIGTSAVGIILVGFFQGMLHATDADHIAAVGTMVSEKRARWKTVLVGAWWGFGHSVSLMVAGMLVIFLDFEITETTEARLEGLVGLMLLVLGLNVLFRIWRDSRNLKTSELSHHHPHTTGDELSRLPRDMFAFRAIVVGMVHGLAGSAGLLLVVLAAVDSKILGVIYIGVFGIGSMLGMGLMSGIIGLPFMIVDSEKGLLAVKFLSGIVSVAMGVYLTALSL
ncbi:MAG: hypothetical protein ACKN97_07750 [Acidobacteriota bacterium]